MTNIHSNDNKYKMTAMNSMRSNSQKKSNIQTSIKTFIYLQPTTRNRHKRGFSGPYMTLYDPLIKCAVHLVKTYTLVVFL